MSTRCPVYKEVPWRNESQEMESVEGFTEEAASVHRRVGRWLCPHAGFRSSEY